MLLKCLNLKNFRQFKGEQKLEFPTDKNKNVAIILGDNTSGKTTLIQAFNWVLYGKTNFDSKDFLLNLEVANNMQKGETETVKVELELIHNNIEYLIKRESEYKITSKNPKPLNSQLKVQYKDRSGQVNYIKEKECEETINKILPEDLSNHFFFDGERITNLAENNRHGKKDIANAVKNVLGLSVLANAIDHLSRGEKTSVIGKFRNSLNLEDNQQLEEKRKERREVEEKLKAIDSAIDNHKKVIESCEDDIDKKREILRDNESTSNLQKELDKNNAEIDIKEKELKETEKNLIKYFSEEAPMYFMQPLFEKAAMLIDEQKITEKSIPEMHSKAIDYILNMGKCICGNHFEKDDEIYNNLLELKNHLPPESVNIGVRHFMNEGKHYLNRGSQFYEEFKERYKKIRILRKEISELYSDNDRIEKKLENSSAIGGIEKEIKELQSKLQEHRDHLEEKKTEKGRLNGLLETLEKDIKKLASSNEKNNFLMLCQEYAESILTSLNKYYEEMEANVKEKLEARVNEIFNKMYHGDRKIVIDNKYSYKLITPDLNEELQKLADESKGLETVTSFAFISGIVDLAREKVTKNTEENDIEFESEPYPLVMDAPFSNADEHHVENVSNILPEVAEQIIMFLMHKDWSYASNVLNSRVEKMYELDKKSETFTVIRGV